MVSQQQIQQLATENEALTGKVKELEQILALKDEELALLRMQASGTAALKSQLDLRLEEIVSMQNFIGLQQRQTAGALKREALLQEELSDSIHLLHQHSDLKQQYVYASTRLQDMEEELAQMKRKLDNIVFERDILLERIEDMEKVQD